MSKAPRDCAAARQCRCTERDLDHGYYRTGCVRHRVAVAREQRRFWSTIEEAAAFLRRTAVLDG
jgi:hypothetical protein